MFRPLPMLQVEILLLRRELPQALHTLAAAGILHLRPARELPAGGVLSGTEAPQQIERCRRLAARVAGVMEALGVPAAPALIPPQELGISAEWLDRLVPQVERLVRRRGEILARCGRIARCTPFLEALSGSEGECGELRALRFARLALGWVAPAQLADLTRLSGLRVFPLGQEQADLRVAILAPRRQWPQLESRLTELRFRPLDLPSRLAGPLGELHERSHRLAAAARRRLESLEGKLAGLRAANEARLRSQLAAARAEGLLAAAQADFGRTERAVVLAGWIPGRRLVELEEQLRRSCNGRFVLGQTAARGEETPVAFANPAVIRPFQRILAVCGTPSFAEVEPTLLLACGFVAMFGMMFGDLGQGLLLAAAGWLVRRRTRWRDAGVIMLEVGLSAALFGVLFGSFFGREDLFPPLWFSPMHDIPRLMGAALAFGIALVVTGLALRVINGLGRERPAALLTDRFGGAGLVFYLGAVATALLAWRGIVPAAAFLWLLLPLAAVFCHPFLQEGKGMREEGRGGALLVAEGVVEVLETVLGFLANTFSFLRLAAFGLAHVGLFMAVFALADVVRGLPLGPLWVALVHLLGNALIVVLEGLIVSIQAVRLQFYEFFGKFFQGGGVAYRPLALDAGERRV
jgi:V/A-type H+-transporting ATPase subunit I